MNGHYCGAIGWTTAENANYVDFQDQAGRMRVPGELPKNVELVRKLRTVAGNN